MQRNIDRFDIEEGWVLFKAGDPAPDPDELPFVLEDCFRHWLARNKELSIRTVLPIITGGNTTAITCGSIEPCALRSRAFSFSSSGT